MFIITYPEESRFLENDLVTLAQQTPQFRQLHDLLQAVCVDARVRLAVRHDLVPRRSKAATRGAPALAAQVTICVAVLRRLMGWSYRTTMEELNVNAGWRWVCQLYLERVPNFRTIQERETQLSPKTIGLIHEVVVETGKELGLTRARKLRVDGSVTETNIHYPTDSSLLDDAARVLSRWIRQARTQLQPRSAADKRSFRDRHRQAHYLARDISRVSRSKAKKGQDPGKSSRKLYKKLLAVVQALLAQVREIQTHLRQRQDSAAQRLNAELDPYMPLVEQVLDQTRARVLQGKPVAAGEKVLSLFEPHNRPDPARQSPTERDRIRSQDLVRRSRGRPDQRISPLERQSG
jgi:IS5 family transposase